MNTLTLWRKLIYKKLADLNMDGKILDLGGMLSASYHKCIKGDHVFYAANNSKEESELYIEMDIEKKFPIESDFFDNIICLNVLEHIFDYKNALDESYRILKKDGRIVLTTPFIYQFHACPNDYWRFTDQCLHKILENSGFKEIEIQAIGGGVFSATAQLKTGLYKTTLFRNLFYAISLFLDKILHIHKKGRSLTELNYPIGFFISAKK